MLFTVDILSRWKTVRRILEARKRKGNSRILRSNGLLSDFERTYDDDELTRAGESVRSFSIFSKGKVTYATDECSSISESKARISVGNTTLAEDYDVECPMGLVQLEKLTGTWHAAVEQEDIDVSTCFEQLSLNSHVCEGYSDMLQQASLRLQGYSGNIGKSIQPIESEVEKKLDILGEKLDLLMHDVHKNVIDVAQAVTRASEYFDWFFPEVNKINGKLSKQGYVLLRRITKVLLHLQDNLISSDIFSNTRSVLLKHYVSFLGKLNAGIHAADVDSHLGLPSINIFAIGNECDLPNKEEIFEVMDEVITSENVTIFDQDGAFIAPVLRGLTKELAVLTVMFGFPNVTQQHQDMMRVLYSFFPDVHFYCKKGRITPCASKVAYNMLQRLSPMEAITSNTSDFIPPYKLPTDAMSPPISMSLSTEDSVKITGTLGGYLYPQISESDCASSEFAGASYAVTCAHVVLSENQEHPYVSVPSTVLQNTYKSALKEESDRYADGSVEKSSFLSEILRIEENMRWQQQNKFGKVVWGERTIINNKLSDFAIIKVSPKFRCHNHLGDDLVGMPDLSLRFKNLYVKRKIINILPGMEVFKIGASSKYTSGNVNGLKMVYWADGKIQSSEFVVSSKQPLFATGGDSGSWILTKLEDELGLGVVGMLHSYDGEQKQIGLFTAITDILRRLHQVTGVQWNINQPSDLIF
ncbi:HHL292Cp [Eremothecium sinecaudum]|uniref:HHL292Cp n=1 Tax=Eremothecium sinecaudum TaxID=45286 RepID=A0A0X8HW28_9SACH|nr:HHL292Cp [Eremothecium sinecaudum]AMD22478.1 HHL292Cp [Eremothecium sinecaudum]